MEEFRIVAFIVCSLVGGLTALASIKAGPWIAFLAVLLAVTAFGLGRPYWKLLAEQPLKKA